ncbi:hypothetical protein VD0004_g1418 [Verticillium dahliae]|nr:hypothetical protein VD0004_g1418 [Verticillium dahliae]
MAAILDDKSPICIPFILEHLADPLAAEGPDKARPFLIGLNGVQGVGKTTLVRSLADALAAEAHPALVLSIDDLYLPHAAQRALAAAHPDNALLQQRGEPGTHDIPLARAFLADVLARRPTRVPAYDKAAFNGKGDRAPEDTWIAINSQAPGPGGTPASPSPSPSPSPRIDVVIVEGWCVGFRALPDAEVEARWRGPSRTLAKHKLEHLLFVNDRLREYDAITDLLDVFVHIDAEDTSYAYDWRAQQEVALRAERGAGMTPDEVVKFVDGYYPAYELYADALRRGVFPDRPEKQVRMVVGKDRKVKETHVI